MITTIPKAVKLWGRGQLTIPKEVRRALKLDEEERLSVFVVGRCLVLTPKRLLGPKLAKDLERSMKAKRLSLEDLLRDLKEERRRYNQERYGA
jgi:AbrB family looped-hinge helix DNA binding protein